MYVTRVSEYAFMVGGVCVGDLKTKKLFECQIREVLIYWLRKYRVLDICGYLLLFKMCYLKARILEIKLF